MTVRALDHVNLRVADVAATVAFYQDLLGMTATPPPGASDVSRSVWLCDGAGRAVIHASDARMRTPTGEGGAAKHGSGVVDHVALECTAYDDMDARLTAAGCDLRRNTVPQISLRQLFLVDPDGVLVELNFRES